MPEELPVPRGGPWGLGADTIMCSLPLVFLVVVTISAKLRLPTVTSIPAAAFMMWLVRLAYLGSDAAETHAAVVTGALDALTPLSIVAGAVCLFSSMQYTQCLPWLIQKIKVLSRGHPVAEVFLIGWAFAYLIEGASGFGTPIALGAPMLAELGHDPFNAVICLLIMSTLGTTYGAVGAPIWFGMDGLGLSEDQLIEVGFRVTIMNAVVAHIVPVIAASLLVPWGQLWKNKWFILMSIWACVGPAVALSLVSMEFSSIVGGLTGMLVTILMANYGIGLSSDAEHLVPNTPSSRYTPPTFILHPSSYPISFAPESPSVSTSAMGLTTPKRRSSIQVATLYFEPHDRRKSFGSAPGDFHILEEIPEEPNPMLFPITHDPLNFPKTKTSIGVQTQLDMEEMTIPEDESVDMSYITNEEAPFMPKSESNPILTAIGRTFPLWGTILLLVVTRIPQLGIKKLLQGTDHTVEIQLGTLGHFSISSSLVIKLVGVMGVDGFDWTFQLLYVPFLMPFIVVSFLTVMIYEWDIPQGSCWSTPFVETASRIKKISVSVIGALVLVGLIRKGGNDAPAFIVGSFLADKISDVFIFIAPLLGALGSFFSGSTTVSNLTFGMVQKVAATKMGRPITGLLALQCLGGTFGNMISMNNIISAKMVLGLEDSEVAFMKKTAPVAIVSYIIGTAIGLLFVFI